MSFRRTMFGFHLRAIRTRLLRTENGVSSYQLLDRKLSPKRRTSVEIARDEKGRLVSFRSQFHLALCAVSQSINHSPYAGGSAV